jgi:hypothetical protein
MESRSVVLAREKRCRYARNLPRHPPRWVCRRFGARGCAGGSVTGRQSVWHWGFNQGNSCSSNREDRALIALTARCIPNCGSTSSRMRTWSSMTSLSCKRLSVSAETSAIACLSRLSTPATRTGVGISGKKPRTCTKRQRSGSIDNPSGIR